MFHPAGRRWWVWPITMGLILVLVGPTHPLAASTPPGQPLAMTTSACEPRVPATCTLRQLADLAGIRFGATAEASEVLPGPYAETLAHEFNSVTPENAMKWYSTNQSEGTFTFGPGDAIQEFASDNDMAIRAHALVWSQDQYTPTWVRNARSQEELQSWLDTNLATVMGHYQGRVDRWDVLNEPLATFGTGLSTSVFHRLLPADWMVSLFTSARAIDPSVELWINEYGTDWVAGKHAAFLTLVRNLVDAGAPIDGVGLQVHRPGTAGPNRAVFEQQLRDFTALGLKVAITELDIPIAPGDDAALGLQANAYRTIVESCLAVRGCEEVTVWGVTDANTWLDSLGFFQTPTRPLLFDGDFAPKPAYNAVRDALAAAAVDRTTPPGRPRTPTVVPRQGSIRVTAVPGRSGGTPLSYVATARAVGSDRTGDGRSCTVTAPAVTCSIGGLSPMAAYRVSVVARNAAGSSTASPSWPTPPQVVTPGAGSATPQFADVPRQAPYVRATSMLLQRKIMTAKPFRPTTRVTRSAAVTTLWRLAGKPPTPPSCALNDLAKIPASARRAACWARTQGIVRTTAFGPNVQIDRLTMVQWLWRLAGRPPTPPSCALNDLAKIPASARPAACWARTQGIVRTATFGPRTTMTRSVMASWLYQTGGTMNLWATAR